jgi:hypothetical protein
MTSTTMMRSCDSAVLCRRSLGGDGHGGVEAERRLRERQIVVDRLRHADDGHALGQEPVGDAEGAVAADRDQRVGLDVAEALHDLIGDVDRLLLPVARDQELERVTLVHRAQDRAAQVGDAADLVTRQIDEPRPRWLEEAVVAALDPGDLPPAAKGRERDGANDGVEPRRVAAAGVDEDVHRSTDIPVPWFTQQA